MWTEKLKFILAGIIVLALAGCGSANRSTASSSESIPVTAGTSSSASGYGVVQAIDTVPREQGGSGLGTAAGAVVGGVLGNQVGSGRGRTAATVAGAAGGAIVGGQMQRNSQAAGNQVYRVSVRMDNGAIQTLSQAAAPNLQIGERVRIANGVIVERFR